MKRTKRILELKVTDVYKDAKDVMESFHLIDITDDNAKDIMKIKDYALNIGSAVNLMKIYGLSIRELEFLYLFYTHGLSGKISSQTKLFDKIRNMKPEYTKTHQDIKLSHPITETLKELINAKLIIKEDKSKFSAFILNPQIFTNVKSTTEFMGSVKEFLKKDKVEIPPLINELTRKITKSITK